VNFEQMSIEPEVKEKKSHMKRVDVRLPEQLVTAIDDYAFSRGISTSELVRWFVIEGLERRDR
jgi:metal-responsive CopG/Arc/MetJ family transcriptional regulator